MNSKKYAEKNTKKIATLGPAGTYSHEATIKYAPDAEIIFTDSISRAYELVADDSVETAILPAENSIYGTILETLDLLHNSEVKIIDELVLDVHHCLAVFDFNKSTAKGVPEIMEIYSHPQALAQCRKYITKNLPNTQITETTSTASGFQKISSEKLKTAGGIGSNFAAKKYGLKIVAENIEDVSNNQTLFFVISKKNNNDKSSPSTYISIEPTKDYPGLLLEILQIFKNYNINLSKIESRPQRSKLGKYIFYFKLDLNSADPLFPKLTKSLTETKIPFAIMSS